MASVLASKTDASRETFASRVGLLMSMIGVAVGLGNVWRFPYMVGKFGGAAFVLCYIGFVFFIGVPALCGEWALGKMTRRGPLGAFERAGLPGGEILGWIFFFGVAAATGYYTNVLGWVAAHALAQVFAVVGRPIEAGGILPPQTGWSSASFLAQLFATAITLLTAVWVLRRGLHRGIERVSRWVMPGLLAILLLLIGWALSLPGSAAGLHWYILKFDWRALEPSVVMAALGQAMFTLSLGGTYMVVYGSYVPENEPLRPNAAYTAAGDTLAGLLAGLAIFPLAFAFGAEPGSGPALLFFTLPHLFLQLPIGGVFGFLFFAGLFLAAFLSDIAALEVLVAGLRDRLGWQREKAAAAAALMAFCLAVPPMINLRIFVPWDLTFGSGLQTFGALVAILTVGWFVSKEETIAAIGLTVHSRLDRTFYLWLKWVVPAGILTVGVWWLLHDVIHGG